MGDIDRLDAERADALAAEARARRHLAAARARMVQIQNRIAALTTTERADKRLLASEVVAAYKRGGSDGTAYLLGAGSLGELFDRADVMQRVADTEQQTLRQIEATRSRIETERRDQAATIAAAASALSAASAARERIDSLLAARRDTLASVSADIRTSIAREQERRRRLAARTHSTVAGGQARSGAVFYGDATWYGWALAGHITASGEVFDPTKLTCANPWLPFGTLLRVTYAGRSVVVRVNDRGPFGGGVIDLSLGAAHEIGLVNVGRALVRIEVVGTA
jgi:rare lipoprotein A